MARAAARLSQNVDGEFFVDESCIDCGTCRIVAPASFGWARDAGMSYVQRQPGGAGETLRAEMALVACPTASIGTERKRDLSAAVGAFPEPLGGGVYYCGYAHSGSFGARSWLVTRPHGNVLVDSPRAANPLLARIEGLGGVRLMFLTHRDDVADHAAFRARFGCERVLHAADAGRSTADVERPLSGEAPVRLDADLLAIPVPGHTRGSAALLWADRVLFTGDHLWADEEGTRLHASRSVAWWSWTEQVRSLERLLDFEFEWVLPGHGRPLRAASPADMRAKLVALLQRVRGR